MNLYDRVKEALSNATDNGYDISLLAPLEVSIDLIKFCPDLEEEDILDLCEAVVSVRLNS